MKTTFKNLGKVTGMLGCTVLQLVAMILRIVSLVFEIIGLVFRKSSDFLNNASTAILTKLGVVKVAKQVTEETT